MTRECSLNSLEKYKSRTCCAQNLFLFCFVLTFKTIFVHNIFWTEFFGEFNKQSLLILWVKRWELLAQIYLYQTHHTQLGSHWHFKQPSKNKLTVMRTPYMPMREFSVKFQSVKGCVIQGVCRHDQTCKAARRRRFLASVRRHPSVGAASEWRHRGVIVASARRQSGVMLASAAASAAASLA